MIYDNLMMCPALPVDRLMHRAEPTASKDGKENKDGAKPDSSAAGAAAAGATDASSSSKASKVGC